MMVCRAVKHDCPSCRCNLFASEGHDYRPMTDAELAKVISHVNPHDSGGKCECGAGFVRWGFALPKVGA